MPLKRCTNPVNNYFIYNDEIRKSTCKVCYFAMAGRHSENLMRHLKRKHPSTYELVLREKQRRRSAKQNSGLLSSNDTFEAEPHNLFIKSEKLEFRVDEHGEHLEPLSDVGSNQFNGNSQFTSLGVAKQELPEELDQSSGHLHDSGNSFSQPDEHNNKRQFNITSFPEEEEPVSINAFARRRTYQTSSALIGHPISSPQQVFNDDASFLQLLGHKFDKYSSCTKYTVQYHINRILYKADMGCYDNADASKLLDV